MKRIIFTLALLMGCLLSHAITVDGLIKKYSQLPDVIFQELKGKALKNHIDTIKSEKDKEILRTAKKLQILVAIGKATAV